MRNENVKKLLRGVVCGHISHTKKRVACVSRRSRHVFGEGKAKDYHRFTSDVNSTTTLQKTEHRLVCAFALTPTEETSYVVEAHLRVRAERGVTASFDTYGLKR